MNVLAVTGEGCRDVSIVEKGNLAYYCAQNDKVDGYVAVHGF